MDENRFVAAPSSSLSYDVAACRKGLKQILLTKHGVAVVGNYDGHPEYVA